MKDGRTLQELAMEIDRQSKAKRDFIARSDALRFQYDPDAVRLGFTAGTSAPDTIPESFAMTGLFHRQIGETLGIPAKYYDRMRVEAPDLLAANVNTWLTQRDVKQTVRTLDGTARAFLSDRYRRIDNDQVIQSILPIIGRIPDARIESCEITETRMYLKVVNPRMEAKVRKDDVIQAGICVSNSEVGLGSVSVMPLVYRLACLNGLIVNDMGKRKYHIGREQDESWELYSDDTRHADDEAFFLKLADIVSVTVSEVQFAAVVDRLREATEARIAAPIADVVEITSQRYGFTKPESGGILQYLIEGGDLTLYGLSNAVTRVSQDADSYDRATDLERAGWRVMNDPDTLRLIGGNPR
jgi:hypothetical protein